MSGIKIRGSKRREEKQKKETEESQSESQCPGKVESLKKVEVVEDDSKIKRLTQVESLKTALKTFASNFSYVKKFTEKNLSRFLRKLED